MAGCTSSTARIGGGDGEGVDSTTQALTKRAREAHGLLIEAERLMLEAEAAGAEAEALAVEMRVVSINGSLPDLHSAQQAAEDARDQAIAARREADRARTAARRAHDSLVTDIEVATTRLDAAKAESSRLLGQVRDALVGLRSLLSTVGAQLIEVDRRAAWINRPRGFGTVLQADYRPEVMPAGSWTYAYTARSYRDRPNVDKWYDYPGFLPMNWGGPRCAKTNREGGCSQSDINNWVDSIVSTIENPELNARGRNWLILNEPDDKAQANSDPKLAAEAWNMLYQRIKLGTPEEPAVDPAARLYCCGTHPGWKDQYASGTPGHNLDYFWLENFLKHVDANKLPDGFHYHNYWTYVADVVEMGLEREWQNRVKAIRLFDTAHVLGETKDFYRSLKREAERSGLPVDRREIVITEWAAFVAVKEQGCDTTPNNRDDIMRPVARYLNGFAHRINHVGAAWFISDASKLGWLGTALYDTFDGKDEMTCLGQEYRDYAWQSLPPPASNGARAVDLEARSGGTCGNHVEVALTGHQSASFRSQIRLHNAKDRVNIEDVEVTESDGSKRIEQQVHSITTEDPQGWLMDYDRGLPPGCAAHAHVEEGGRPITVYRFNVSSSDLPSTLKVRLEATGGQPQSDFSPVLRRP